METIALKKLENCSKYLLTMDDLKFLTKENYFLLTKKHEGGHWTPDTIERRWDYHYRTIELLKSLNISDPKKVLELGTMGITCVDGSDTMDYFERWEFEGKKPTIAHDARITPWPIENKKYDVFIALRVFQHLVPKQNECLQEAFRIANKVIIILPEVYNNSVLPDSKGFTYADSVNVLNGIHPNIYFPTAFGSFFYWDSDFPSKLNLKEVMKNVKLFEFEKSNLIKPTLLRRIKNQLIRIIPNK